jgi:TetR/AcrR family transcriptional regulator, regulator of autoinduction and epiphytic fitness
MSETGVTDGRTARAERTRAAVVDALLALLDEGATQPTASEIAERAGVSLRSVYVHFRDREDLFVTASRRQLGRLTALVDPPPPPEAPTSERVRAFVAARARIDEAGAGVRRAAMLEAARSPAVAEAIAAGEKIDRAWVREVLAPELRGLSPGDQARLVAAVDTLACGTAWDRLRGAHGLAPRDAEAAVADGVMAVVTAAQEAP